MHEKNPFPFFYNYRTLNQTKEGQTGVPSAFIENAYNIITSKMKALVDKWGKRV